MPLRFEIDYRDTNIAWEPLVDEVFGELKSSFIEMPKGEGFIDYPTFERGYRALKRQTDAFASLTVEAVVAATREAPIAFIVFPSPPTGTPVNLDFGHRATPSKAEFRPRGLLHLHFASRR